MTDKTSQALLEGIADKVLPGQRFPGDMGLDKVLPSGAEDDGATREEDQFHDTFHNSDEIKTDTPAPTLIPVVSEKISDITTEARVEVTRYLPELEYPPRTPSSHNKSLEMYSTPDQEEREPIHMRKLDLATDNEIPMDDLGPIGSPVASPTKETVEPASILGDSDIVAKLKVLAPETMNVDQFLQNAEITVTELAPDMQVDQLTEKLETAVTGPAQESVNQLKETMETNLTELAPDMKMDHLTEKLETVDQLKETVDTNLTETPELNVDELTAKLESAATETTNETLDQLKELAPELNVDELTAKLENAATEATYETVDQLKGSMAPVLDDMTEREQQGLIVEIPVEGRAEREIVAGPVFAVSSTVNEVVTADLEAQQDDSETSTVYEEISEDEDGSDSNLHVDQGDLFEEVIVEDDYEEEELIESDDSHEEEEIIDEEEEVVEEEIEGFKSDEPEKSSGSAPSESIPKSDDEIKGDSFSSASSGGAFLSAIEEGDEHSYQSGDRFAPLPPVPGTQEVEESPVEIPASFDNVSEEQTEEQSTIIMSDKGVEVDQIEETTALAAETPEEFNTEPQIRRGEVNAGPVDLDDSVEEEESLPPGWKSHVDPDSGDTYYYNEETGETTWEIEDIADGTTNQRREQNQDEIHESLDKDIIQSGQPAIICDTMANIPEADVEESSPTYSDQVFPEKEQSLVESNNYGDPQKASGFNNDSEDDNEKRVEELLEDSTDSNPLKSPAVLCLLCAICLVVLALIIAIPLALNINKSDDTDREITFPTGAPSPMVRTLMSSNSETINTHKSLPGLGSSTSISSGTQL